MDQIFDDILLDMPSFQVLEPIHTEVKLIVGVVHVPPPSYERQNAS